MAIIAFNPASAGSASRRSSARSTAKSAIGQSCSAMSAMPFPLSRMPRTMRRKWVSGKDFADHLRPVRHAAERKHEPGKQDRRQEDEERHLHRLKLVLREGGKRDAHREIRRDEDQRDRAAAGECCRPSAREREMRRDQDHATWM